jgi:hypothetical protein
VGGTPEVLVFDDLFELIWALVHKYFSPPRTHSPQKADLCAKAACIIQSLPPFLVTVVPCAWAAIKASDFYLYV